MRPITPSSGAPTSICRRTVAVWIACAAVGTAQAAETDSGCQAALDAVQAREAVLVRAPVTESAASAQSGFQRPADPPLMTLRRRAAAACLGSGSDPRPASAPRAPQPPITVAPISGLNLPRPAPLRLEVSPPASARPPSPSVVTSCDPAGCWTDTGARLSRLGPDLWGPGGRCVVQGPNVRCP